MAWSSTLQDGDGDGVFARRFDSAGTGRSEELQVNLHTEDQEYQPALAMDRDGDFVVAWTRAAGPRSDDRPHVFARLFDAAGAALGPAFHVNSYTPFSQYLAAVDLNADGDFVVTWTTQRSLSDLDVAARRGTRAASSEETAMPKAKAMATAD